jgi:hypothetical protein
MERYLDLKEVLKVEMGQRNQKKAEVVEEETQPSFFSAFFKSLRDVLVSNFVTNIKENIKEKVQQVEKKIFHSLAAFVFFLGGVVFIFLALIFLVNYYFKLHFAWGFLIAGILFICISLLFKWLAKRD